MDIGDTLQDSSHGCCYCSEMNVMSFRDVQKGSDFMRSQNTFLSPKFLSISKELIPSISQKTIRPLLLLLDIHVLPQRDTN